MCVIARKISRISRLHFTFLPKNPGAGHWRKNRTDQPVKFFPGLLLSYLVVYRTDTKPLQVVYIIHGRRDVEQVLKGRL